MATLAAASAALEKYCGFPASRTRTVARRLLEEEILTPGAPGVAVDLNEADFALLLLGVASGAPLSRVADKTAELAEAVSDRFDTRVMPAHLRPESATAFEILHGQLFNAARNIKAIVSDVEVVETYPEIVLHLDNKWISIFRPVGADVPRVGTSKQRRSTRIPATAIVLAAHNLFSEAN
ncbi:hypothetical protein EN851_03415 [Mesorhizobium sp. M8A.F.Ca.ET.208.01.1.1]|uniref:hypothetical protein n=1 Tax=unclassified Mesorhizobium TaxID=325217 RepID=UPI0010937A15|nr:MULTISPECIES: hypothetical protein [unclassified Mesorhizobium]TGQ94617.1 hypothetical protein EN851_03415 [Mesorhizobium sp. M8A.F.Ca.ET.208.01.1.1]TGT55105.1 hypothetical protein EN810_03415 [Mesorhizobium sp. M8A.F.Ca.ET.167.01.1.1]